MNVLGISGSLRGASFNTSLLHAMRELAPDGMRIEVITLHGIPLYDGDLEDSDGVPGEVVALRDRIKAADALIMATPEYNHGIPGVLKNAIDWLTRPPKEIGPTFHGRPLALAGATPGGGGTILAQAAWLPVLRQLRLRLFPDHMRVAGAGDLFEGERLEDERTRERVRKWLDGFDAFAGE